MVNGDGTAPGAYEPFPGLVLTDTFQSYEDGDRDDLHIFPENNERITRQRALPITVIVGNPPYSVGQDSANDDNANASYPTIDTAIRETYAARASNVNKVSLYDSYIRAIKWASLRIEDRGIIAFVTNGGWLDANTADGMRLTLAEEFSSIHVYNLRGNQRTAGELSRREGGKVFGGGSRATVAITVLVKNPEIDGPATVHYADIGDYLTRQEKLAKIASAGGVTELDSVALTPNAYGDWLNQRAEDFETFFPAAGSTGIFETTSHGLKTNRDAWATGFSRSGVLANMQRMLTVYERVRRSGSAIPRPEDNDPSQIAWGSLMREDLKRGRALRFEPSAARPMLYKPFTAEWAYFRRDANHSAYRLGRVMPTASIDNHSIVLTSAGSHDPFSVLCTDRLVNHHTLDTCMTFPRWTWDPVEPEEGTLDLGSPADGEVVDGYRRIDNITEEAQRRWQAAYGDAWTKDDVFFYVYGLLHSPEYRERYAADLKKMLPRVPLVATANDARAFADAGRTLSELHIGYESVAPYELEGLDAEPVGDPYAFFAVGDKKMRFGGKGKEKDRSVIHYNDRITVSGIPEEAYRYMLGSRSAIEWVIDRYWVKTDKASGIVNDPNVWSREVGDPRYILDLLARVVTVSIETMRIVDNLPALDIREEQ